MVELDRTGLFSISVIQRITWIVDYVILAAGIYSVQMIYSHHNSTEEILRSTACTTLAWTVSVSTLQINTLWYIREQFYFYLLGTRASIFKRTYRMDLRDFYYILRTCVLSAVSIAGMIYWDIVYFVHPDEFFRAPSLLNGSSQDLFGLASVGVMSHSSCGVSVVLATLFWFYTILSAKELFLMNTFHRLMHSHPFWYSWHRTHHTIGRNSCFQLAYRTDIINLFIEDAAAPMVVWVFLWLIGCGEVRIPIYSLHLLALFDGGIHSINPFTVLFWNPIADLYMNANIVHGLHHNRKNTHLTTVPLYHLFDAMARTRDETEYDRVMKTTLFKRTGSTELERVGICDQ